tara:strand:+ start:1597 stop:1809 length:213 start_codon:yes stop_codon:yes gene_type:complete
LGDLQTEVKHCLSGNIINTDAPNYHDGKGRDFTPTDLLVSSLGSFLVTIMGIEAKRKGGYLVLLKLMFIR